MEDVERLLTTAMGEVERLLSTPVAAPATSRAASPVKAAAPAPAAGVASNRWR